MRWYDCSEFRRFPFACRMWIWWCKHGLKRNNGGTVGGNRLYYLLKYYLTRFPFEESNYLHVKMPGNAFIMVVDLLDFEIYNHTIPMISRGTSEMKLLDMLCYSGCSFMDMGANHGVFSLYAAHLVGEKGNVIAVEPQPRLATALFKSKQLNGFEQLQVIEAVVCDDLGTADFFIPTRGSGVGSLLQEHASQNAASFSIKVRTTTVDQIVKENNVPRVDIIKFDLEGAELKAFQGALSTLQNDKPFLWFEMNPFAQSVAGIDPLRLIKFLSNLGYAKFFDISKVVSGILDEINIENFSVLTNILSVHHDRCSEFYQIIKNYVKHG